MIALFLQAHPYVVLSGLTALFFAYQIVKYVLIRPEPTRLKQRINIDD